MKPLVWILLVTLALTVAACQSSSSSGGDDDTDTGTGEECSSEEFEAQQDALLQAVLAVDPCFTGHVFVDADGSLEEIEYRLGHCVFGGFMCCHDSYQHSVQIEQAAEAVDLSCWADQQFPLGSSDPYDDIHALTDLVDTQPCYPPNSVSDYVVAVMGDDGEVTEVYSVGEVPTEDVECVDEALTDQVFSCLAGLEICSCYGEMEE